MVLKGYDQGQAAARLLRARLEAERDTFPFLSSVPEYLITDYKVLQGYNLHNTPLPKGSQQINRPENYWQKNQQEIVVVGLTLGFLMVDRKSTRLNSSHVRISYAVFCLKKKKK